MTRTEAIKAVGIKTVEAVETENCEPTNRLYDHEDGEIEWSARVKINKHSLTINQLCKLPHGDVYLSAVYYTDATDSARVEANGGDWGGINWDVHHYSVD